MRALKSLLATAVVSGLMVMSGSQLFAGPLLPSFPAVWPDDYAIAGQSKLVNPTNPNDYINVDWIVLYDVSGVWGYPGAFVYMYQLENTAGTSAIRSFNVSYAPGATTVPTLEVGIKSGDLDESTGLWLGHNSGNFANLGTPPPPAETEPGGGPQGLPGNYNAVKLDDSVSFTTVDIAITQESLVLYIIDPRRPVYGEARAQDDTTWWGMVTLGGVTYGNPVPVPSPEPGSVMLLFVGAMGTLVWRRLSKR